MTGMSCHGRTRRQPAPGFAVGAVLAHLPTRGRIANPIENGEVMSPVGPLKFRRTPEPVRQKLERAAAAAWEAVVDTHADHAARFVTLMSERLAFDQAVNRYLAEIDIRDPMASAIRSRTVIRLADLPAPLPEGLEDEEVARKGLKRFRPDVLAKGIARRVRESEAVEEWVRLAIARAEEGVLLTHIENAVELAGIVEGHLGLDEAVEDYIDLMRLTGGRAQSVYQRTMARLADLHLPPEGVPGSLPG
jgi:hypothetical protein